MRTTRLSRRALVSAVGLSLLLASCGGTEEADEADEAGAQGAAAEAEDAGLDDWPTTLVFGAVPAETTEGMSTAWDAFISAVSENLGVEIELREAASYSGIIESQLTQRIDIAYYGPFAYTLATQQGVEVEIVGATADGPDGVEGFSPSYQALAITSADNDAISDVADFAGETACLVDPSSTSGGLVPRSMMMEADIDVDNDVTIVYTGSHDAAALGVVAGDCSVGFVHAGILGHMQEVSGEIAEDDLKVVAEFEVPSSGIVVGSWLPEDLKQAITEAMLGVDAEMLAAEGYCSADEQIEDEEGRVGTPGALICPFSPERAWSLHAVSDEHYDPIRTVCELTKAPACDA